MSTVAIPSVDIVRNKGFMFKAHALDQNGTKWERRTNGDSDVYENTWVKFTNWHIANLEAAEPTGFGGIPMWEAQLEMNPTTAVAKTYAILHDKFMVDRNGNTVPDVQWGAQSIPDGEITSAFVIFSNAMFLANGMDPDVVVRATAAALKERDKETARRNVLALKQVENQERDDSDTPTTPTDQPQSQPSPSSTESSSRPEDALVTSGA